MKNKKTTKKIIISLIILSFLIINIPVLSENNHQQEQNNEEIDCFSLKIMFIVGYSMRLGNKFNWEKPFNKRNTLNILVQMPLTIYSN